jgi:hypothetical protein
MDLFLLDARRFVWRCEGFWRYGLAGGFGLLGTGFVPKAQKVRAVRERTLKIVSTNLTLVIWVRLNMGR